MYLLDGKNTYSKDPDPMQDHPELNQVQELPG